jgi:hypothetical protein
MNDLERELKDVIKSHGYLSDSVEDIKSTIGNIDLRVKAVEKEVCKVRAREVFTQEKLFDHNEKLDYLEQIQLENNLVISNVVQVANENPAELAARILKAVSTSFSFETEILSAFRMKAKKPTDTPPLLVKFGSATIKRSIMRTMKGDNNNVRKIFCDEVGLQIKQQIYFNHHLTAKNQILLGKARAMKKKDDYHTAYYSNGLIWVKKTAVSTPIKISSEEDLEKIAATAN